MRCALGHRVSVADIWGAHLSHQLMEEGYDERAREKARDPGPPAGALDERPPGQSPGERDASLRSQVLATVPVHGARGVTLADAAAALVDGGAPMPLLAAVAKRPAAGSAGRRALVRRRDLVKPASARRRGEVVS